MGVPACGESLYRPSLSVSLEQKRSSTKPDLSASAYYTHHCSQTSTAYATQAANVAWSSPTILGGHVALRTSCNCIAKHRELVCQYFKATYPHKPRLLVTVLKYCPAKFQILWICLAFAFESSQLHLKLSQSRFSRPGVVSRVGVLA